MNAEELAHEIDGNARQVGNGWIVRCPAHSDARPSLSIDDSHNGTLLLHCHAGCSSENVIEVLKQRHLWNGAGPKTSPANNDKSNSNNNGAIDQSDSVCTLESYAASKRLDISFLKTLGIASGRDGHCVRIPYRDAEGKEVAVRYRVALTADPRFKWRKGSEPCLYGLERLEQARKAGFVVIVEGESDCHTLWQRGVPAIGLPGAGNWRENRDAAELEGIERIYVVIEPDQGGNTVKEWLRRSQIRDRAWLINLGRFKDPSGLYLASSKGFDIIWPKLLANAVRAMEVFETERQTAHDGAYAVCEDLAKEPKLLNLFIDDLRNQGMAGEERAAKLTYLCLTSRVLDRPVSAAIKGPSSAGKSYLVDKVLQFFPADAYYSYSAMSEKALAYGEEPLQHRTIVIFEAVGLGKYASYLMRSLLSEGCIKYQTVGKKKDGNLGPLFLDRDGPTNLIVTTTAISLHPENETRYFSIPVADTSDQTKFIMKQIASNAQHDSNPIPLSWIALQEWIGLRENRVSIPYAGQLADSIPAVAVRLRRDFSALLSLIKAHACLHQRTRLIDDDGRIVATLEDYAVVRDLVADLFAVGVEAMVPGTVRETVEAVITLTPGGNTTTSIAVAKLLDIDSSSALRRLQHACELGVVLNQEERKGRPGKYMIGQPLPEEQALLPSADDLRLSD